MRDENFAWDPADARQIVNQHNQRVLEGDAAEYVRALFEGLAVRQAHLRASNDSMAIAASNATFAESQARLNKVLNAIAERT